MEDRSFRQGLRIKREKEFPCGLIHIFHIEFLNMAVGE